MSVIRTHVVACRALKFRFLFLVRNPSLSVHWDVRLVHRRQCCLDARHVLDALVSNDISRTESHKSVALEIYLATQNKVGNRVATGVSHDMRSVVKFAMRYLLDPRHGTRKRTILYLTVRSVSAAFLATELVDGIIERANL